VEPGGDLPWETFWGSKSWGDLANINVIVQCWMHVHEGSSMETIGNISCLLMTHSYKHMEAHKTSNIPSGYLT
jgi:hypothetical protein